MRKTSASSSSRLLVSSGGCPRRGARHGAVCLLMAASRLVHSFEPDDPFLRDLRTAIDENVVKVMSHYDGSSPGSTT